MLEVFTTDLAIAFLIVVLAGFTRGFTGFVEGLVNVGLLTLLYGPVKAIALAAILGLVSSTMLLLKTAKEIEWHETLPLCLAVTISTPIAAMLLLVSSSSIVKPAIGALIMVCGVALLVGWKYSGPRGILTSSVVGAISGGITGYTGSGGPLMVFYYLASPASASIQRANISFSVFVITLVLTLSFLFSGVIDLELTFEAIILFPGAVLGTWFGMRAFEMAPHSIYQLVARWSLVIIGVVVAIS